MGVNVTVGVVGVGELFCSIEFVGLGDGLGVVLLRFRVGR